MINYFFKRLFTFVLSLALASIVIFSLVEIAPGDPASFMLGINAQEDTISALRTELGLDQPKISRYFTWIGGMLTGDFGISYTYRTNVTEMVGDRLWVSLPLAIYSLVLSTVIAIPTGIYAAAKRGQTGDVAVISATQFGIAVPNFWFAIILVGIFAIKLQWFSAGGFPGWQDGLLNGFTSLTLPAIALALPQAAILSRIMRSALIETLGEDYIRTARAKGLSVWQTIWRHALRNALIPVLTILGLQFSFLLAGAIIIEQVFYLPGLGRLVFQAITQRDLIVVESVVMLLVSAVILINFIVDIAYMLADPRLRLDSK